MLALFLTDIKKIKNCNSLIKYIGLDQRKPENNFYKLKYVAVLGLKMNRNPILQSIEFRFYRLGSHRLGGAPGCIFFYKTVFMKDIFIHKNTDWQTIMLFYLRNDTCLPGLVLYRPEMSIFMSKEFTDMCNFFQFK